MCSDICSSIAFLSFTFVPFSCFRVYWFIAVSGRALFCVLFWFVFLYLFFCTLKAMPPQPAAKRHTSGRRHMWAHWKLSFFWEGPQHATKSIKGKKQRRRYRLWVVDFCRRVQPKYNQSAIFLKIGAKYTTTQHGKQFVPTFCLTSIRYRQYNGQTIPR